MLTRSSLVRAAVAAVALSAALCAVPTRAQPPANSPWLFLSTSPEAEKDPDPAASPATVWESGKHRVLLRPNVEQALYLYVRNPTERDQSLTVVLAAGPDGDEFASVADVRVPPRQTVRVRSPRPAPVVSVPPAAAKPPPPSTTPLPQGLHLRLLAGAETLQRVALPVRVQEPSQYVAAEAAFEDRPGAPRRLIVTLYDRRRDDRPFPGPPAKVSLDLSPARVPELIPDSLRGSTLRGDLPPGGRTALVAVDPRFRGPNHSGIVAVGVDGYKRAFLFETDFGGTAPQPVNATLLHLDVGPRYFLPGKPCLIGLEVDKPPSADVVVEFGIDRSNTGEFTASRYAGDRFQKAEARWDAAASGLVFVTEARDWVEDVDSAGMTGPRKIRLRLLDRDGKVLADRDGKEMVAEDVIVFDDTPPEGIRLTPASPAIRNRVLNVAAAGADPESGVARVLFFLGEPPDKDGKPAPGGRVVEGVPPATADGPYTGQLPLPDRTGRVPIGVRFINNVGLARDLVDEVEVTDPPPKPTTGAIKVTVGQGSPARPQPGLNVELRDEKSAMILKTGKTNEKGEYTFEGLAPGKYVVYSSKPADFSKAQQAVTVEAGKTEAVALTIAR